MNVLKRDGTLAPQDLNQVFKQLTPASKGLKDINIYSIIERLKMVMFDGIRTDDVQKLLIKSTLGLIDIHTSDYQTLAGRLSLYDMYHKVKRTYNKTGNGDIYKKIHFKDYLKMNKDVLGDWVSKYDTSSFNELNGLIKSENDQQYNYIAIESFKSRYLITNTNKEHTELIQHMFLAIAMFAASVEEHLITRLTYAKLYYEILTNIEFIPATPILANGRLHLKAVISCGLRSVEDDLIDIFDVNKEIAIGSKFGIGWGVDLSKLRSKGSMIGKVKNVCKGKVPFMKILNSIALAVDQGGVRLGVIATFINDYDLELEEFIKSKSFNGEERLRCRDLHIAVNLSDITMERCEKDLDMVVFDPYDVNDLVDLYGEAFNERYIKYEAEYLATMNDKDCRFNSYTVIKSAKDIFRTIIKAQLDDSEPFLMFTDNVNKAHKHKHLGKIRQSNLCTEILQPTNKGESAVCNLGSLVLPRLTTEKRLTEVTALGVRFLDAMVTLTDYKSPNAKKTQLERRSLGLGVVGEAETIANKGYHYGDDNHKQWIKDTYSLIENTSIKTSIQLADEKGSCIIQGYRNAYLMAIAPNTGTAIVAMTSNNCEPFFDKMWTEENGLGDFKVIAPGLTKDNIHLYKGCYDLDQGLLLELLALRTPHVDQSISHTFHIDSNKHNGKYLLDLIFKAWKLGVKTLYYVRNTPPSNDKLDKLNSPHTITCFGCDN